ncbi:hypothetical protein CC2G_012490 [Coprinopsis cinerea AmutBmut pab1-1]|nr:hypothetical protein CC2G_012490 [Coprinopsis cinerea AmutBmut pab1-1]
MDISMDQFSSQAAVDMEIESLQGQRQDLLEQLKVISSQICDLKSRRNEFCPISRLPKEVLHKIFLHLSPTQLAASEPTSDGPSYSTIVCVTRVCRYWKKVALNQPELWTYVSDYKSEAIRTLLMRSKTAPLDICLDRGSRGSNERWIQKALATRTIRSLSMRELFHHLTPRLKKLPPAAPVLHTLILHNNDPFTRARDTRLPELFQEGAPLLRKVSLFSCHLPWTSPLLEGLTSLRMLDRNAFKYPPPSPGVFLDALEKMPDLVELSLYVPIPDLDDQATRLHRVVALPRLRRLEFWGSIKQCHDLLQHVVIPESATIELTVDTEEADPLPLPLVPRRLVESPQTSSPAEIKTPQISFSEATPQSLEIEQDGVLHFYVWTDRHDVASFPIKRDCYVLYRSVLDIPAIQSLPAWSIRSLRLQNYADYHGHLGHILRVLVAAEDVFVSERVVLAVVTALQRDPGLSDPTVPRPLEYLPALKTLVFESVVNADGFRCVDIRDESPRPIKLDVLYKMLKGREDSGARLEKLVFQRAYNMTRGAVDELAGVVGEVVWDGVEDRSPCVSRLGDECPCRQ